MENQQRLDEQGTLGLDFLRSRYIGASTKVYLMVRSLNRISNDRYLQLAPTFHEICRQVEALLVGGSPATARQMLITLSGVEAGMEHLCGGKAATLAVVSREGLSVPPGFVISTELFRTYMEESGLGGELRQLLMLREDNSFKSLEHLEAQIDDLYDKWLAESK